MARKSLGFVIINDDKDICDLLAHLLINTGYDTQQGYDGSTALVLLTQREPDLLLLDRVIPEPNGMAVLAKIPCNLSKSSYHYYDRKCGYFECCLCY